MIYVIPFTAGSEPSYLPLLSRGLSDLSVLRLNAVQIESEVNIGLKLNDWQPPTELPAGTGFDKKQEFWLTGSVKYEEYLSMEWILYAPDRGKIVYYDHFTASEEKFMGEWEKRFNELISCFFQVEPTILKELRVTRSLEAFLEFRKGLELLSQAKTSRIRQQGLESLLNAVAYDATFIEAADVLILFILQNNLPDESEFYLKLLERLRQILNNHPRIPLVMADIYLQLGNPAKTEQLLQEMITDFPGFSEGWIRFALHQHSKGCPEEALATLDTLLQRDPENLVALDLKGAIYAGMGERALAQENWLKVLQLDGLRVNVLNNLGLLAEENNQPEQAEAYYRQAIDVNEQWWGSYYNFGSFCRRQGRLNEAVLWLEKAGWLNGGQFQIFYFLGITLFELGRYRQAQEVLLHLLKIAPDNYIRQQGLEMLDRFNNHEVKLGLKLHQLEQAWQERKFGRVILGLLKLGRVGRQTWYYWYLWGRLASDCRCGWLAQVVWGYGLNFEPGYELLKSLALHYWQRRRFKKALPLFQQAYRFHHNDPELLQPYIQTMITLGEGDRYDLESILASQGQFNQEIPK